MEMKNKIEGFIKYLTNLIVRLLGLIKILDINTK